MTRFQFVALGLLLTAILAATIAPLRQKEPLRWEYHLEGVPDGKFESVMAGLGYKGWELVFARRANNETQQMEYECIFKRPLSQ